jgi:uncharacterized protein (TIGR02147 family)
MRLEKDRLNIFEYDDYRKFLKDWYKKAKAKGPGFSYRAFSHRAGLHSSNFFMLVMQGKRNLTEESVKKVAAGLGLNKQEQEFFRNLVFFNQARTHEDKDLYYKQLLQSRKFRKLKPIEKDQYEYYSNWYHPIVRELVIAKDFDGTPEWVASHIYPSITAQQAARSIELLEKLKFIERTENGKWRQTASIVSTGDTVNSVIVHNYHKEMLSLTKTMMDDLATEERDVSSLTLGIDKSKFEEIRSKIKQFRQEILKMASTETSPDDVVQLNIQFYNVMKDSEKEEAL